MVIQQAVLRAWAEAVLGRAQVPPADAALVADHLVEANLRGVDTHGISRLPIYVKRLRLGLVKARPDVRVVAGGPALALMDGDDGLGIVVATRAMDECIGRARAQGAAFVAVRRTTHFGACAYYTMRAAAAGMVGFAFTNGEPSMAPTGSLTPYVGTNPLSIAVPGGRHGPIVLDMATSVTAAGRILLAQKRGQKIPLGWATDAEGNPTDDPATALAGLLLPMAGYKGYALALMIDILAGVLSGAASGPRIGHMYRDFDRPQNVGDLFAAIDIAQIQPLEQFTARIEEMVDEIHSGRRAPGVERIYVPGEIEAETRARRLAEGIPLDEDVAADLRALGEEMGVAFPSPG